MFKLIFSAFILALSAVFVWPAHALTNSLPPYTSPIVENLLSQMTLNEKIKLVAGTGFASAPIERLKIPALEMTDGPIGIRFGKGTTAFPAAIAIGATFDPGLVHQFGVALGEEARSQEKRLLLGPTVNITRTPWGGRVFESYGEDPFLNASLAREFVSGVQSQGVGTSIKHFAVNNQEWGRGSIDVHVSERALQEIYWPAFKAGVEAGTLSVMSAYNRINGTYCSENSHLLNDTLKTSFGFNGFVISDWGANHSTVAAANNGLDLEMPDGRYFGLDLLTAVKSNLVSEATIDDKVRRILFGLEKLDLIGPNSESQKTPDEFSNHHPALALNMARKSLVLLKNDIRLLPLDKGKKMTILVAGPSATRARSGGGGSSFVHDARPVSAVAGLQQRFIQWRSPIELKVDDRLTLPGDPVADTNIFSNNILGEYFDNLNLSGPVAFSSTYNKIDLDWEWGTPDKNISGANGFSARYTADIVAAESGDYQFRLAFTPAAQLFINDELLIDRAKIDANQTPFIEETVKYKFVAKKTYRIRVEYFHFDGLASLQLEVKAPSQLSNLVLSSPDGQPTKPPYAAILFVGQSAKTESESFDRTQIRLSAEQEKLILDTAAKNSHTIVVVQAGSPIDMSAWISKVSTVVYAWYPGEQGGLAIADALFGETNFSGHLPISFPKTWADSPVAPIYPGANGVANFTDDIYVGYRAFDKSPGHEQYRFGYGLSYSDFSAKIVAIDPVSNRTSDADIDVHVLVRNESRFDGAFLAQLYVGEVAPTLPRPKFELKAFKQVQVAAKSAKIVKLHLNRESFQYYNDKKNTWLTNAADFNLTLFGNDGRPVDTKVIRLVQ